MPTLDNPCKTCGCTKQHLSAERPFNGAHPQDLYRLLADTKVGVPYIVADLYVTYCAIARERDPEEGPVNVTTFSKSVLRRGNWKVGRKYINKKQQRVLIRTKV